ncbi:MAG: MotA/TolQ/ExbB proton channel family protein [Gammaproteobacteria bacterium]|nr:MotA/TolQ/ExbB proton channel family protein [Gammaproteobacteria bacterium]
MNESITPIASPAAPMGIADALAHGDAVSMSLLGLMAAMSLLSWYFILTKAWGSWVLRRKSQRFEALFWNATDLAEVSHEIQTHGAEEPFAHLASHAIFAREHHARAGHAKLNESGSLADFLTRTMRRVIDEETARLESGLTLLASVASTAPFVGLFGTVWGVFHALMGISTAGAATLDKVAGPVGEALVMTGLGLAVAIPAVLAYNSVTRFNRVYLARLDTFAHDLFAFLTTGQAQAPGAVLPGNVAPLKTA